jgi:HK97 family phage major capsid protein
VELLARTDKNHATSVSGGFTVTRKPETVAATASRMEMEKVTLKASTLMGLAYATEEILVDSVISFIALIDAGFRDQFAHHMLREKIRGLGGNEYQGVIAADCTIAESRDTATRILGDDVLQMRARCWGYGQAIWIANHDCFAELMRLGAAAYDTLAATPLTGSNALYVQSLREDRPDSLLGRPIFYSEYASTLGGAGDLSLCNWSQYLEGLYQPLQSAESMHVRFSNHERAFKFWLRNAGAPWWRSALTPNQSTTTLSPFVILAA